MCWPLRTPLSKTIGRPAIYGLSLGGSTGTREVFEHLKHELEIIMQLAGTQTIEDIRNTTLRNNDFI